MKPKTQQIFFPGIRRRKYKDFAEGSTGVALFLAISLLALFSVLGASYLRYMSLELDESDMRINGMRIRNYAAAGINSVAGHIRSAILAGEQPQQEYVFTYNVYGMSQEKKRMSPKILATYTAQAQVLVKAVDRQEWNDRISEEVPWPGNNRVFCVTSMAKLQRAVPGGIIPLASHSFESIVTISEGECRFLTWHSVNANVEPEKQE